MKQYEPITGREQELKIEVRYNKGGVNFFSGKTEARGYYLSVSPVTRSHSEGYTVESYTGFSGIKKLILPVARQSDKQYQAAVALVKEHVEELKKIVLARL